MSSTNPFAPGDKVTVRQGRMVDQAKWMIRPDPLYFSRFNIQIHGITDQYNAFFPDVIEATGVVPNTEIRNVVVQRIAREITAPDVFLDAAVHVIADDSALVIVGMVVVRMICGGTKRRNFDDLPAEAHVREPESPTDETAIRKQGTYLVRGCIRGNVEVLGVQSHQRVTYTTADQERLITGFMQSVQYLERALRDFVPGDAVG